MSSTAIRIFIAMFLLAPSLHAAAQDEAGPLTIDDIMALKLIRDPQISPDGAWVAYTVSSRDMEEDKSRTRIWMVPAAGGEPIPMTAEEESASRPRWSPDNKYLSFLSSRGEKAKTQLWTLNRLGGEAVQVTKVKQGVGGYDWSPDGSRLLLVLKDPKPAELTEDEKDDEKPLPNVIDRIQFKVDNVGYLDRRRSHIYLYTPGDESPVQVTSGDFDDEDPVWSPDGTAIAFVSDRSAEPDLDYGSDVWTVDVSGEDFTMNRVTSNPGR
ncbi:MAG: S9 family peptidase, partial [Pseudomonadota bacterium]